MAVLSFECCYVLRQTNFWVVEMFWFTNSKHPASVLANLSKLPVFVFKHGSDISIFVMSHFRPSNRNINLTSVDLSAVLMLLMWEMSVSPLANLLSLVFTIYRGLMSHYQMSYPVWHQTLAVLQIRSDVFLFQSEQAWLMIFSWEKKISTFTDGVITNNLNNNDKEKLWMEIFFPFEWLSLRYLRCLFWSAQLNNRRLIFMEISGVEQQHPCKSSRPQW